MNNALYSYDGKRLIKYPSKAAATEYTVQSGTEVIDSCAFWDATNLKKLTIPASVTHINFYSIRNLTALTSLTFADGSRLKRIGNRAIWNCDLLTRLDLPASLEVMENNALEQNTKLKTVTIADGSKLKTIKGQLTYPEP